MPIKELDPIQIEDVRLPAQITKVLHHRKTLVEVPGRDFRAFDNLTQHLRPRQGRIAKPVNHFLPASRQDRNSGCRQQGVDVLRVIERAVRIRERRSRDEVRHKLRLRGFQIGV